jgi:hypothetical protein
LGWGDDDSRRDAPATAARAAAADLNGAVQDVDDFVHPPDGGVLPGRDGDPVDEGAESVSGPDPVDLPGGKRAVERPASSGVLELSLAPAVSEDALSGLEKR